MPPKAVFFPTAPFADLLAPATGEVCQRKGLVAAVATAVSMAGTSW